MKTGRALLYVLELTLLPAWVISFLKAPVWAFGSRAWPGAQGVTLSQKGVASVP